MASGISAMGCVTLKKSTKCKLTQNDNEEYKYDACDNSKEHRFNSSSSTTATSNRMNNPNPKEMNQIPIEPMPPPSSASSNIHNMRGGLRVYKIVVLGDGGVGKSAVTLQFVSHNFLDYHDPTIEDSYQQQAVIDGEAALLDILDTAGQVEFTAMRDQYMRCGEGFIICYSVVDRHSYEEASQYRQLIQKVRFSEDIPLVLIANKCDLQSLRKVTTDEGKNLANQFGCPFFETSAALRLYIDEAFYALIREIRRKEKERTMGKDNNSDKINQNTSGQQHSRWWRLRSIFAIVFRRRRRHQNLN